MASVWQLFVLRVNARRTRRTMDPHSRGNWRQKSRCILPGLGVVPGGGILIDRLPRRRRVMGSGWHFGGRHYELWCICAKVRAASWLRFTRGEGEIAKMSNRSWLASLGHGPFPGDRASPNYHRGTRVATDTGKNGSTDRVANQEQVHHAPNHGPHGGAGHAPKPIGPGRIPK